MSNSAETDAVQDRRNRLRELTEFTEACEKQIKELLQTLGWSPERSQEEMEVMEETEVCPCDRGHRVPARSLEAHTTSCSLTKKGYPEEEQVQMCSSSEAGVRSFVMDKDTQHQVIQRARSAAPLMRMEGVFWQGQFSGRPVDVPHNHKRAVCDLTVADRLALYDHVVGVFRGQAEGAAAAAANEDLYVDLVSKLQKDEEQREPKTHLELMAEMRDYKRRRQSYRAKNVHITKKSYTEVIREVISVHSEELARQWREELEDEEGGAPSEGSAHRPRSASSESRLSGGRRHHSRDRESKKKKKRRDSRSPELHKKKKKKKHKEERQGRRSDSN